MEKVIVIHNAKMHYATPVEVKGVTGFQLFCNPEQFTKNGKVNENVSPNCGLCNRLHKQEEKDSKKSFSSPTRNKRGSRGEIDITLETYKNKYGVYPTWDKVFTMLGGKYTPQRIIRVMRKEFNINPGNTSRKVLQRV